jgi:hypothetical protein
MNNNNEEAFVTKRRVSRYSGRYTPGFYSAIKISPAVLPPKRKYFKKIKNNPDLSHFKTELESLILKNLKSKGNCLRSGIFIISVEIERFLKNNYLISKRWQNSQAILDDLEITSVIYRPDSPDSPIEVSDFQMKLGNSRKVKYHTKVGIFF